MKRLQSTCLSLLLTFSLWNNLANAKGEKKPEAITKNMSQKADEILGDVFKLVSEKKLNENVSLDGVKSKIVGLLGDKLPVSVKEILNKGNITFKLGKVGPQEVEGSIVLSNAEGTIEEKNCIREKSGNKSLIVNLNLSNEVTLNDLVITKITDENETHYQIEFNPYVKGISGIKIVDARLNDTLNTAINNLMKQPTVMNLAGNIAAHLVKWEWGYSGLSLSCNDDSKVMKGICETIPSNTYTALRYDPDAINDKANNLTMQACN